jgi:pimeloyl-ACP methyl ester carboxylesterase
MPFFRSTTFDATQARIHVAVGPDAGPPLVLLHGVTRRWHDFVPLLPSLACRWEIHAIDLRGHGQSGRVPGGYRAIDYADDIVEYLRGTLEEPAVVLGHSLGGMVAAAVAARVGSKVRAVVLEDPPFESMGRHIEGTIYPALFSAYRDQELAGSTRPVDELAAALSSICLTPPGQSRAMPLGSLRDPTALRFQAACLRHLDPGALDPIIAGRWLDGYEVDDLLGRIECPALLLYGDPGLGGLLPEVYAAHVASRLRRGTAIRMEGVGHQIHWMQTESMLRYVIGFLEALD